jgi:hypothetical protein
MADDTPQLETGELTPGVHEKRIKNFSDLLEKIDDVDDKKKQLWREIYENAITDRQNAFVMFVNLSRLAKDNSTEHAVHGRTLATYLERMGKANDQLIKLAELISRSDPSTSVIDPDEMFSKIKKK